MNKLCRLRALFIVLFLLIFIPAALADKKKDEVDRLFSQWDKPDTPGCALAVIKDGKIIHERGYGSANLEYGIPIKPDSVFYVGSDSKQFVAMSIAMLAKEGKLSLDDDIRKFIPELPDYGTPITIRNLIHHTSGLRDYLTLLNIAGIDFGTFHEEDVLELIARQKELNFKPGEEYLYSNSGYFLLGIIVNRASGKTLRQFTEEKIFIPLGMKNSHFHDDYTQLIKNRAWGYFPAGKDGYKNFISTFDCVGSGGLYTTGEDLFLWDQNFYHCRVGGKELISLMETTGELNNGKKLDYAFGLVVGSYKGLKTVSHSGALGGFRACMIRFPEQSFSVICLSNLSTFNPTKLSLQVADIYLANILKEEQKVAQKEKVINLPEEKLKEKWAPAAEQLEEYQGEYFSEELQVTFRLGLKEGKLYFVHRNASRAPLLPDSKDNFSANGLSIQFIRDKEKKISAFTLNAGRVKNLRFIKIRHEMRKKSP
jgi:CubicO group peptidase (beta-lactamase class C family)